MQFSLFYDYYAIVNACSFLKKYDALFQAFDMIYDCPDFPALGRIGVYPARPIETISIRNYCLLVCNSLVLKSCFP